MNNESGHPAVDGKDCDTPITDEQFEDMLNDYGMTSKHKECNHPLAKQARNMIGYHFDGILFHDFVKEMFGTGNVASSLYHAKVEVAKDLLIHMEMANWIKKMDVDSQTDTTYILVR